MDAVANVQAEAKDSAGREALPERTEGSPTDPEVSRNTKAKAKPDAGVLLMVAMSPAMIQPTASVSWKGRGRDCLASQASHEAHGPPWLVKKSIKQETGPSYQLLCKDPDS